MHSIILFAAIAAVLATQFFGLSLSLNQVVMLLAVAVAVVGLPHGALDHVVGRKMFSSLSRAPAIAAFMFLYVLISLMVVAGWFLSPVVTIAGFFALSAWHFGLEEDDRKQIVPWQWAAMVARGGMVIWIPATFQGPVIAEMLTQILPLSDATTASLILTALEVLAPALALLTVVDAWTWKPNCEKPFLKISSVWQHRLRILAFAFLFAFVHPLISFGIYFCGWHSIRGLVHLREEFGGKLGQFTWSLLPISAAAIVLFILGFGLSFAWNELSPAIIQTLFIGLSAVAIPHLLLHVVSDSLASKPIASPGVAS